MENLLSTIMNSGGSSAFRNTHSIAKMYNIILYNNIITLAVKFRKIFRARKDV